MSDEQGILQKLQELKAMVAVLVEKQQVKEWYTIAEVARILGKADFTVREWARLHRIRAKKSLSGRGAHQAWVVSADEVRRIQKERLLPIKSE